MSDAIGYENGWTISLNRYPVSKHGDDKYEFIHDDYDASWEGEETGYISNGLHGTAGSIQECWELIKDIETEHGHFKG